MKNILKITIIVFAMANFAVAQSTSYFKWIGKHPDEAAEDVALQFDKAGDKLVSIDDTENFGYDERGQRNTKIESTTRVLVFESGTQLDIRFNPISQITKLTFNLKNTPSYFQLKSQLNLNALKVIEENDNYVCFEGLGLGVNVTIHEVKSPLGLINNEYTVELSKNSPKKYFNPTVFNIDSIDITNSYQTIANHINANLTTKGFKYLNQTDLIPITTSDKSLSYYILNNNYSEGVNINFQLYPSKKVKTIIINSTNPITKIKLGKLFFDELLTSQIQLINATACCC